MTEGAPIRRTRAPSHGTDEEKWIVTELPSMPDAVAKVSDLLRLRGYTLMEDRYEEQTFGNVIRIFEIDTTRVQIFRDRGKWGVGAAPSGTDRWFWASNWEDYFAGGFRHVRDLSADETCDFFVRNLEHIESANAEDPRILQTLSQIQRKSAQARGLL